MRDATAARPRLGGIRAVTYTVPDLQVIEDTYPRWLDYRVVARGEVPAAVADAWGAPAIAQRAVLTLAPSSGEPVYLRFVAMPEAAGWTALTTHGWNVSEIVVQDVDALAAELADSPFRIIGSPASLQRFPTIRAMQVLGPLGECLYFTQVGEGSGLDLAAARSFVGRVFIVVAGGPDLDALFRTYAAFANEVDPPVSTRVRVISLANGLPPDTEHAHGLVKLRDGTLIELDQYPAVTRARNTICGGLPAGMAMVTFAVDELPRGDGACSAAGVFLPDDDSPTVVIPGAAGELIELMETAHA
ncbi:MAG TPA: hypothetical protein VLB75_08795 [Steroidobacteraceae bacterium]|nr:hypothetical protein [Steroidobacteraceae bacterium]